MIVHRDAADAPTLKLFSIRLDGAFSSLVEGGRWKVSLTMEDRLELENL